jgi:hypothetical protein
MDTKRSKYDKRRRYKLYGNRPWKSLTGIGEKDKPTNGNGFGFYLRLKNAK